MDDNKLYAIYKKLSDKYDLSVADIERVCRYQFKNVRDEIKSNNLRTIQLPFLGKFAVKPRRKKHVDELIQKAYDRKNS